MCGENLTHTYNTYCTYTIKKKGGQNGVVPKKKRSALGNLAKDFFCGLHFFGTP
jgi:hypothetical protein